MFLLYFIFFSLPLYLVRFSVFGIKTNILDVFLILFIIWQIVNYKSKIGLLLRSANWRTDRNDIKYVLPIILILIGAIIATVNSSDISRSLGILKSYFILPILFFFTASFLIKTQEQKEKVLKAFFLSGTVVSLVGIFYWLAGDLTYDGRLRAFFESPNQLAMFLAPAFIAGIFFVSQNANYRLSGKQIATCLTGLVIFLTKSVGAISAIFAALLFYLYKKRQDKKIVASFILATAIILFFMAANKQVFSEKSSLASRVMIWQSAGAILKDNWILGIGPGTFQEKYLEYQKYFPPYLEWASPQPHNVFLAFWLQTGIVGFAGFLWLIFIFFKNIWQNKNDAVIFLSGILMIYTLAHGLIDTTYWRNDLAIIFWMVILLSLSLEPIKSSARQD